MITRKEDFIMKENLKVLMLNGSPKANGNTAIALREMEMMIYFLAHKNAADFSAALLIKWRIRDSNS